MTDDPDPRIALRREIVKVSRRLAVLHRLYGGLDNAWTAGMIEAAEARLAALRWELRERNRGRTP